MYQMGANIYNNVGYGVRAAATCLSDVVGIVGGIAVLGALGKRKIDWIQTFTDALRHNPFVANSIATITFGILVSIKSAQDLRDPQNADSWKKRIVPMVFGTIGIVIVMLEIEKMMTITGFHQELPIFQNQLKDSMVLLAVQDDRIATIKTDFATQNDRIATIQSDFATQKDLIANITEMAKRDEVCNNFLRAEAAELRNIPQCAVYLYDFKSAERDLNMSFDDYSKCIGGK